ncbi:MAG: hypothetical protein ABJK28_09540 [Algibacter sp.]
MKKNFALIYFILLIITGCSYNFSSDNYLDIEKPSTGNNSIIIDDFNNSDIINTERLMTYSLSGPSNPYQLESKIYLNDEQIGAAWDNGTGSFKLFPSRYEDGIHKLRFEHSFFSGSGSLADQLGQEVLTKKEVFEFIVQRKTTQPPTITEAKIENGSITIKWNEINGDDFENAYLSAKYKTSETRTPLTREALNSREFIDKNTVLFTGNSNTPFFDYYSKVTYSILLTNEYTENYGVTKEIVYDPEWVVPKIAFKDFESYNLIWPQHPMYANFENFEIVSGYESLNGSSQGGEQTINYPYVFGGKHGANIRPIDINRLHSFYSFREIELDEDSFGFFEFDDLHSNGIVYNTSNEKFYTLVSGNYVSASEGYELYIYEYSKNMEFLQKSFITNSPRLKGYLPIQIDPSTQNFYIDTANNSYLIDKNDFSILKQAIGNNENGIRKILRGNIVITNTGWFPTHTTIENIETNSLLYSGDSIGSTLSEGGTYIFISDENERAIYKIDGNQLSKILDLDGDEYTYQLIVHDNTLMYSSGGEFSVIDLNTMNKKSFDFGTYQKSMQFDPISNKLLLINSGGAGIFYLNSDKLENFIYEDDDGSGGTYFMYLQNGRLFHSKGIYIDNF